MSRRILIADANADAADSLAMFLQLKGHCVATARTGPDTLAIAAAIHPEAAFLSLHLAVISGLDVCRKLCNGIHFPRPRVLVALTGDGRDSTREASLAAGFDHHLLKPAEPAEILRLIRSLDHFSNSGMT